MEQKVKADQLPAHAHRLYVQLYCERKGEKDKKTIQEAKKSWKSLSLSKKKLFHKTTLNRNLLNHVHGLSQTKTYLKEKAPKLLDKKLSKPQHGTNKETAEGLEQQETASIDESILTENGLQVREETKFINDKTENYSKLEDNNETLIVQIESPETQSNTVRPVCEPIPSNFENEVLEKACETQEANIGSPMCGASPPNQIDDEIEDALETQSNASTIQGPPIPLVEPTPPTVRIGKDLFEMIKPPGSAEWKDLSKKERAYYNAAVCAIKREYIESYTNYLGSLTKHQLFDHYVKHMC